MVQRFLHFYRTVYVPDHAAPLNRWVHFGSNVLALGCCGAGVLLWDPLWFALGVWFQLGPPYLGHVWFEKTHRSVDQAPVFAALGSWFTTSRILLGRQRIGVAPTFPPERPDVVPDLLDLVKRHGRALHSFLALEPGLDVWGTPDGQAAVAYADRGGHWLAAGAPLCAPERVAEVARAFAEDARQRGRRAAFFAVDGPVAAALAAVPGLAALPIGRAPVWDPRRWDATVAASPKLRNRLRRGERGGVVARTVAAADLANGTALRARLQRIARAWQDEHVLPPMGFLVTLEPYRNADERRYALVEADGELVGFAVCVPAPARPGWLVEDVVVAPDAPPGAAEVLVDHVMRRLAAEGAALVSLGLTVLAGAEEVRHPVWGPVFRLARARLGGVYPFHGLERFRSKLAPEAWEPVYLIGDGAPGVGLMRAVLVAFAGGPLVPFALRAAWRWAERTQVAGPGLGVFALGLAGLGLSVVGAWQGWALAPILGVLSSFALFTPVHEAAHRGLSRDGVLNDGIGTVAAIAVGGALQPYRWLHDQHHRRPGDRERDPDQWSVRGPRWTLPLRWLTADLAYGVWFLRRGPRCCRKWLALTVGVWLTVGVGAAAAGPDALAAVALGWWVPARIAMALLAATFTWLPHADDPVAVGLRRSIARLPGIGLVLLGQHRHQEHHEAPGVPFSALMFGRPMDPATMRG